MFIVKIVGPQGTKFRECQSFEVSTPFTNSDLDPSVPYAVSFDDEAVIEFDTETNVFIMSGASGKTIEILRGKKSVVRSY